MRSGGRTLLGPWADLCYSTMLLITAALNEELRAGLDLCRSRTRFKEDGLIYWTAAYSGQTILFLKTGVGPDGSAKKLSRAVASFHPDRILVIGYAGALEPGVKIGDLAVLYRSALLGTGHAVHRTLEQIMVTESYELHGSSELVELARGAGLCTHAGTGLTSPLILGDPHQKRILHRRFQALAIDMETAALARVSSEARIPIAAVRAISDEVDDEVLAPFSYDPDNKVVGRAVKVLGAGKWLNRFALWREHSAKARESLGIFLRLCFETWSSGEPDSSWLVNPPQRRRS